MKAKVPKTTREAFAILDKKLTKQEKLELANSSDLFEYHFGLGLWIRNNWLYGRKFSIYKQDDPMSIIINYDGESEEILLRYRKHLRRQLKEQL